MKLKGIIKLEKLGWVFNEMESMKDYIVLHRNEEILWIDLQKERYAYIDTSMDATMYLSLDCAKAIIEVLENGE